MALPSKEAYLSELEAAECPICLTTVTEATSTDCRHIFCLECLKAWVNDHNDCPTCRQALYEKPVPSKGLLIALDGEHMRDLFARLQDLEGRNDACNSSLIEHSCRYWFTHGVFRGVTYDTGNRNEHIAFLTKYFAGDTHREFILGWPLRYIGHRDRVLEDRLIEFFAASPRFEARAVEVAVEARIWDDQVAIDRRDGVMELELRG